MSEDQEKRGGFFRRIFRRGKTEDIESDRETSETGVESEEPPKRASLEPVEDASTEKAHVSSEPPDQATGLFRLRSGLDKTRNGFIRNLDEVFLGNKQLDDKVVQRLEEVLITADIGVQTAYELLESVTERVKRRELDDPEMVMKHLKVLIKDMLSGVEAPMRVGYGSEPFVVMVLGVNGSGKTTTIAKIAARHKAAGRKVMIVAGDTFRAGAVEQVEIWAERIGCQVVRGKDKADPSSVVFEAIQRAIREDFELVLVDTAGRLHTRVPLMEELKKVHRTMGKKLPQAPHEILLVIDASMGQNAILQARTFNEAVPVTGVCLTKLDGTSKGGVILGISNELKIPIRFIGIGEKMDDLRDFNAGDFVEALFADEKPHR
jgi:fused signal recognition particle receptor